MPTHAFPAEFIWGAATSAQQIEGGRSAGGRGDSIWDTFARIPGKIEDASRPDTTCDHFHLWREDIERMRWLGLGGYRFSTSWARVVPDGRRVNESGLDFYDRLVDGLLAAGIEPYLTLNHWDLPQALQDAGGWAERDTAQAFVDYAAAVSARLGDRVRQWCTHNEPWCMATLGHEEGHHAPGHEDPAETLRVAHHLLLSHGWAVPVLRSNSAGAQVGIVIIHTPAYPATESDGDRDAARWFDGFFNRWYLDPLHHGAYPADAVADRRAAGHLPDGPLPFVVDGDMEAIAAPLDYLGVNYYSRVVMRAGADGKPAAVPGPEEHGKTEMGWEIFPAGLTETLRRVHRDYAPPAILVTENGSAFADPPAVGGRIADEPRMDYLRRHLAAVAEALADGVPVRGYFAWSLLDNFEWGYGFTKRFGLFRVDFDSQERTAKDSAHLYREIIANNSVSL